MSIQTYQELFAWNVNQGERLSFDISDASLVNSDLVVVRSRVHSMSSKQTILASPSKAITRNTTSKVISELLVNDSIASLTVNDQSGAFEARKNPSQNSVNAVKVTFKSEPETDFIKTPTLYMSRKRQNYE